MPLKMTVDHKLNMAENSQILTKSPNLCSGKLCKSGRSVGKHISVREMFRLALSRAEDLPTCFHTHSGLC